MSSQQTIFMEEPELKWYAVTTRSRHEKVVAEQLWQKEIECFLPLREVLSTWKDRRKKIQLPLFPGYLFVHVPIVERRLVFSTLPYETLLHGSSRRMSNHGVFQHWG